MRRASRAAGGLAMAASEFIPIGLPEVEDRTILLVEDDPEMRELLAAVLRRHGYRVCEAPDGDRALEWLGPGFLARNPDHLPAVIVSDIWLPYCSGIEILE